LAVQVFDQKKFKKKDQGFLGVINIRVGDVMPDLGPDSDGTSACFGFLQKRWGQKKKIH
jgi:hypothetical protein